MRNLLVFSMLILTSCVLQSSNPPEAVSEAFSRKFPDAKNVKWGRESKTEWEASFIFNNGEASANFNAAGEWLETEIVIPVSDLPEAVVKAIEMKDQGGKIVGAAAIEKADTEIVYEADIKIGIRKKEVFYKPDGSIVDPN